MYHQKCFSTWDMGCSLGGSKSRKAFETQSQSMPTDPPHKRATRPMLSLRSLHWPDRCWGKLCMQPTAPIGAWSEYTLGGSRQSEEMGKQ
jgi:hypothetical protein